MARTPTLFPDDEGAARFLPWVIAAMAFLATLAGVAALLLGEATQRWQAGLAGSLTVELPAADAPGTAQADAERVLAALRGMPGVAAARPLSEAELAELLAPWLGPEAPLDGLPLPRLIDVELAAGGGLAADDVRRRLAPLAPGLRVDDHMRWLERLVRLVRGAQAAAAASIGLIAVAMATVVVFAVRAALAAHERVLTLLHLMGARDDFIARQFQARALAMGLKGGLIGLGGGGLTLFLLGRLAQAIEPPPLPPVRPDLALLAVLAAVPLASAAIAFLTARLTVLGALKRLP